MKRTFGVHIGQQNLQADVLRALWRRLDSAGMDWLSIWDHLYEAPPAGGTLPHFETLTTLGALAADTQSARIGCLVFCTIFWQPNEDIAGKQREAVEEDEIDLRLLLQTSGDCLPHVDWRFQRLPGCWPFCLMVGDPFYHLIIPRLRRCHVKDIRPLLCR